MVNIPIPSSFVSHSLLLLLATPALAQTTGQCNPALWRDGTPQLGTTVQFTMHAAPLCVVGNLLALDAGPTQILGASLPVGVGAIGLPLAIVPATGAPVSGSLAIPNNAALAGVDVYQVGIGLSLQQPASLVRGASGRFRIHGPTGSTPEVVLIGEQMLDNGISTVIQQAQLLGTTPEFLVNDSNTVLIGNPWLPWSQFYAGSTVTLPTGHPGNEGMYALPANLPFPLADFVAGLVPQHQLAQIFGVSPLRNADLVSMVGRTFVGIAWDSSLSVNYAPLYANLQGERLGRIAFTVLDVRLPGSISESNSSTSQYDLVVRVEGPQAVALAYAPLVAGDVADSIQINVAEQQNNVLTVSATSALGSLADMTVSVDGFTFESPMAYVAANAQYEARFVTTLNLVGRRVTVSSRQGGSYSGTVQ